MQRSGGVRRVVVGIITLVGPMLLVDVISAPPIEPSASQSSDALGQVEVRERQTALSDGRTTSDSDAASGLSTGHVGSGSAPPRHEVPSRQESTQQVLDRSSEPAVSQQLAPPRFPAALMEWKPALPAGPGDAASLAASVGAAAGEEVVAGDWRARRGAEALALIEFRWHERLPRWRIDFLSANSNLRGLTLTEQQRIEIYLRESESAVDAARVIAHELGHAVDLSLLQPEEREIWRSRRGIDAGVPWWPGDGLADFATGAGDFAECFATWQVGADSLSQLAGPCSSADQAFLAEIVEPAEPPTVPG